MPPTPTTSSADGRDSLDAILGRAPLREEREEIRANLVREKLRVSVVMTSYILDPQTQTRRSYKRQSKNRSQQKRTKSLSTSVTITSRPKTQTQDFCRRGYTSVGIEKKEC